MKKYLNHASLGLPRCPKRVAGFFAFVGFLRHLHGLAAISSSASAFSSARNSRLARAILVSAGGTEDPDLERKGAAEPAALAPTLMRSDRHRREIACARGLRFNGLRCVRIGGLVTKLFICAAIVLYVPSCGWAATDVRSCVLKATEALPKVPGLKVKKAGARPMPPEHLANWKGQSKPIIVDLDTDAPSGARDRYSYLCASNPAGRVYVQRILD